MTYQNLLLIALTLLSSHASAEPPVTALAITPDHQQYIIGSQSGLSLHQLRDGKQTGTIATQLEHVHDMVFAPDGHSALVVGGTPGEGGEVELITWPTAELKKRFKLSTDLLYRVRFATDSKSFVACCHDGCCYVVTLTGETIAKYAGHSRPVLAVDFINKGDGYLSAGIDQTLQLWSADGSRVRTLNNHTATVTDFALQFSQDASGPRCVSIGEDRSVRLWYPNVGRMVKFLRLENVPRRVAWRSDGQLVVACDAGDLLEIDADEMKVARSFKTKISPVYELVVTDDGVLVGGVGGVELVVDR